MVRVELIKQHKGILTSELHDCPSTLLWVFDVCRLAWRTLTLYEWSYHRKKLKELKYSLGHSVHLFLTIKPQVLINITLDVFPCSALRKEPLFMAYPSLRILPGNQHSLPPGGTSGHMAGDHTLFIYKQKRNSRMEFGKWEYEGGIASPYEVVLQNHSLTKPEMWRATLPQIMTHGVKTTLSHCVKPAFHSVHQEMWGHVLYCMGPSLVLESPHEDYSVSLTWHSNSDPVSHTALSVCPYLREAEAGLNM